MNTFSIFLYVYIESQRAYSPHLNTKILLSLISQEEKIENLIYLLLEIKLKASCVSGKRRGLKPSLLAKEISVHAALACSPWQS